MEKGRKKVFQVEGVKTTKACGSNEFAVGETKRVWNLMGKEKLV